MIIFNLTALNTVIHPAVISRSLLGGFFYSCSLLKKIFAQNASATHCYRVEAGGK